MKLPYQSPPPLAFSLGMIGLSLRRMSNMVLWSVVFLFALMLAGCDNGPQPQRVQPSPQPPAVVSATINGRTVRATVSGCVQIRQEGDAAVVTTEKHKFVVEPSRFLIDGAELLKLRPKVDFVEFYLNEQGYFTMNADLAGVAIKQLPSANPFKKQQGGGATRLDGRTVHFSVFGDCTISPEGDTAVITTETHRIVVEPDRVTMDGVEELRMAPTAKDVRVLVAETGRFELHVDGSTAVARQLAK